MKLWKTVKVVCSFALLSGCASDLISPPYEDHPNLKVAEMARERGDVAQSIHNYRDIIKEYPQCEKAYIGLGTALIDANVIDEARKTFEKALGLFPKSSGAYAGLGAVYLIIDQPENASHAFNRSLQIDPQNARALNGYGVALDMLGEYEAAQANYRAAMELDSSNQAYESNLALSLALSGNEHEAIRILERLVRSPKVTPRIRQNLALAYGLAGDMKMAKKIGRIDLSNDWVVNNMTYFEAIKKTKDYAGIIPKNHTTPLDEARKW